MQEVEKARLQLASKAAPVSAGLHLDHHEQEHFSEGLTPSPRSAGTSSGSSKRL